MKRLLLPMLVSGAAHGLIFATWPQARIQPGEVNVPVLHARLMSIPSRSQATPPLHPSQHRPEPSSTEDVSTAVQPELVAEQIQNATRRVASPASNEPPQLVSSTLAPTKRLAALEQSHRADPPSPANDNALRAEVLAAVHGKLANHFFYPQLARRKGWQGRVDLGFRVEADGRIQRIRVVRSSGHGILDRSAIQALRDVGSVSVMSPVLGGSGWELDLPVIYRLREG